MLHHVASLAFLLLLTSQATAAPASDTVPDVSTPSSALETLELLKEVQKASLELEKSLDDVPGISESLERSVNDGPAFQAFVDLYASLLDQSVAFGDNIPKLQSVHEWTIKRLEQSAELLMSVRAIRNKTWFALKRLQKTQSYWLTYSSKLNRHPDMDSLKDKMEVQMNCQLFLESVDLLKQSVIALTEAMQIMDQVVIGADD